MHLDTTELREEPVTFGSMQLLSYLQRAPTESNKQDIPRMTYGIQQSQTEANTYVPTYIVGENSLKKSPLSRISQTFQPYEQYPKHETVPDWHIFMDILLQREVNK